MKYSIHLNKMLESINKKIEKENFISVSKKAKELKFENGSKDSISTILLSILQMWKQHIMYLNNEENRYLAELRDALVPDLMSGKIELQADTVRSGGGENDLKRKPLTNLRADAQR